MAVLHNYEAWAPWAVVAEGLEERHEVPAPTVPWAELPAKWRRCVEFAVEFMFVRTGGLYPGPSPFRYQPTADEWGRCEVCHLDHWPLAGYFDWRRTGTCPGRHAVELGPAPVVSIESVVVDDITLDPAGYRLVDRRWLARTSGTWPGPPTSWGDDSVRFRVDYVAGSSVPTLFAQGAIALARELVAGEAGSKSKLPPYWSSITRDGFTVTARAVTLEEIERAFTGISPLIDQALALAGPVGTRPEQAAVAIPGRRRPVWLARA